MTEPGETTARWQFKYDNSHELTEMIDGRSGKTTNEYNSSHQVTSQTDPAGRTLKFEYEEIKSKAEGGYGPPALGSETSEEETQEEASTEEISEEVVTPAPEIVTKITHVGTGAVTLERFNNEDELQYITKGYGTSSATTEKFTYATAGAVASLTDGNEHTTKYEYDGEGNRIKQIDPNENTTKWEYDKPTTLFRSRLRAARRRPSNGKLTVIPNRSHVRLPAKKPRLRNTNTRPTASWKV